MIVRTVQPLGKIFEEADVRHEMNGSRCQPALPCVDGGWGHVQRLGDQPKAQAVLHSEFTAATGRREAVECVEVAVEFRTAHVGHCG